MPTRSSLSMYLKMSSSVCPDVPRKLESTGMSASARAEFVDGHSRCPADVAPERVRAAGEALVRRCIRQKRRMQGLLRQRRFGGVFLARHHVDRDGRREFGEEGVEGLGRLRGVHRRVVAVAFLRKRCQVTLESTEDRRPTFFGSSEAITSGCASELPAKMSRVTLTASCWSCQCRRQSAPRSETASARAKPPHRLPPLLAATLTATRP